MRTLQLELRVADHGRISLSLRAPPPEMRSKHASWKEVPAYSDWARPCRLPPAFMEQCTLGYDMAEFDFVGAAQDMLGTTSLETLHRQPIVSPAETPPQLRRAQIQAQVGSAVSKQERKSARTHAKEFETTEAYQRLLATYTRFIHDWVVPQLGDVALLYQRKPILRVVLPGSVPPTAEHCVRCSPPAEPARRCAACVKRALRCFAAQDADYFHDANEINYWVPLTPVWGSNSLWSESRPGAGDFAPFVARAGQAVRFYGNRCRHYTVANDSGGVRVSFECVAALMSMRPLQHALPVA
jgi:hypothetical protein